MESLPLINLDDAIDPYTYCHAMKNCPTSITTPGPSSSYPKFPPRKQPLSSSWNRKWEGFAACLPTKQ
jgi:hypothetical protein